MEHFSFRYCCIFGIAVVMISSDCHRCMAFTTPLSSYSWKQKQQLIYYDLAMDRPHKASLVIRSFSKEDTEPFDNDQKDENADIDEMKSQSLKESEKETMALNNNNLLDIDLSSLYISSSEGLGKRASKDPNDIAYFYLQDTLGLSEEVMWKITFEAGSILGMTVKNLQEKIALLQRTMNLSTEDIQVLISRHPPILHLSASKNLSPSILTLVRALDLSKADLKTLILSYPCILSYSPSNIQAKLDFFTNILGFAQNDDTIRSLREDLLLKEPKLLCAAVETGLIPRLSFWVHEVLPTDDDLIITKEELQQLFISNPRLLLYSIEQNLRPKIQTYFYETLLFTKKEFYTKILKKYPYVLDYSFERQIEPLTTYLQTELEYSPMELRRIWCKFPRIVSYSLYNIKHVVGYLRYTLQLDADQVKRVLFQAPQIIGLNTDRTLQNKVKFLQTQLNLTSPEEVKKVLVSLPTILLCSIERNIEPKIQYFQQQILSSQLPSLSLKEMILLQPTLLGYSLEKRIKPRMRLLQEYNIPVSKLTVCIPMKEPKFQEWLIQTHWKLYSKNMDTDTKRVISPLMELPMAFVPLNSTDTNFIKSTSEENPTSFDDSTNRKGRVVHWRRNKI